MHQYCNGMYLHYLHSSIPPSIIPFTGWTFVSPLSYQPWWLPVPPKDFLKNALLISKNNNSLFLVALLTRLVCMCRLYSWSDIWNDVEIYVLSNSDCNDRVDLFCWSIVRRIVRQHLVGQLVDWLAIVRACIMLKFSNLSDQVSVTLLLIYPTRDDDIHFHAKYEDAVWCLYYVSAFHLSADVVPFGCLFMSSCQWYMLTNC